MFRMQWLVWSCAALLAAGLVACGDEPPSGGRTEADADAGTDTQPDTTPDIPVESDAQLVLLTEAEPSVSFSERVPMRVRYIDPDEAPIADAIINFAAQQSTADSALSAANAFTDANGEAEIFIEAGVEQVDFTVRISVPDDDTVAPLDVPVRIQPKDQSDYIVRVNYDGPLLLNRVEVLLFDNDRACNTLQEDPEANPSTDTAWTSLVILPDAEGVIPERGLNVPNNVTLHYAVARGEASKADGSAAGFFATFGCQDVIPEPDVAEAQVIEIDMHNLWPSVEGTYQITTQINLLNLVPDNVENFLGPIGEIFGSPGTGILRLVAVALGGEFYWNEDACAAEGGSQCDIWGLLFECTGDNPETEECDGDVTLTTWGVAATAIVESLVDVGIAALPDSVGDTINDVLAAGAAVFENAEEFVLAGNLVIEREPDASGSLGTINSVVFNRITWKWVNFDDPENELVERSIQLRNESFMRGEGIGAALVFNVDEDDDRVSYEEAYYLQIDPFDLSLNYGEVLIFVLEGILFPTFIGPEVDSFEDLFAELIDCEELGEQVAEETASGVGAAVEAACEALQTTAIAALEDWLSSLTLDLSTYYHMGTPIESPCPAAFAPASSDFEIQSLGEADLADRCQWDGEIRYDSGDEPESVDGSWWGEKL